MDAPDAAPANGLLRTADGDTIVAVSTPPGRSAIAVIRMSGPTATDIAGRVLAPWPLAARVATKCVARDPRTSERLDSVVATFYQAPRSYTGEDLVEIGTHGGSAAPAALLRALTNAGARPAAAGEFTRRALLNGKLDLTQAEAIGDLIDARSDAMRRAALVQLDGGLSRRITALREALLDVEALLAYDIDFPEEDDGPIPRERVQAAATRVIASLDALLATAPAAALIRDGAVIAIAGPPNAGKSSLFNALIGEARAIVTDVPGTTRDAIEVAVDHGGWPLRLVDTAGLRQSEDIVERLGIEVSERYIAGAAVVLACGENDPSVEATRDVIATLSDAPIIAVRTKADVRSGAVLSVPSTDDVPPRSIRTSANTGEGLHAVLDRIVAVLAERYGAPSSESPLLMRDRHLQGVTQARTELERFLSSWNDGTPAPIAAVHVRGAIWALDDLVGAIDTEDVLSRLFASFCVGK
jgi:tRNA modification GTPase